MHPSPPPPCRQAKETADRTDGKSQAKLQTIFSKPAARPVRKGEEVRGKGIWAGPVRGPLQQLKDEAVRYGKVAEAGTVQATPWLPVSSPL